MAVSGFDLGKAIGLSDLTATQRLLLLTMQTFADSSHWILWPSNTTLARHMGCDKRTVQKAIAIVHEAGLIAHIGIHASGTNHWQINADELVRRYPPPNRKQSTGGGGPTPPPRGADSQGGGVTPSGGWQRTTQTNHQTNQELNNTTAEVALISILGSDDLLTHPNATTERVEWVVREAPTKKNPAGWAAGAIRKGYIIPPKSPVESKVERRAQFEKAYAQYESLPDTERHQIMTSVLQEHPSLDPTKPDNLFAIRGATAKMIDPELKNK